MKKIYPICIFILFSACSPNAARVTAENVPPTVQGITLPPKWTETRTISSSASETPGRSSAFVPTTETVDASTQGPTPTIVPPDPSGLIGKRFDPDEGGELLILATELDYLSHFLVVSKIETGNLAWIERFLCWDPDGIPYFEVKDAVLMEPFSSDQSISLDCWSGGQPILYALGVGSVDLEKDPVEFVDDYGWLFGRLDYGYFLDVVRENIVPVSTAGWTCIKPFGL
jgi:hypothetical protein